MFNDRHSLITITNVGSGLDPWAADLEKNESGWDVLVATYITHQPNATALTLTAQWQIGALLVGSFWVVKVRPRQLCGGHWLVEVTCHGIAGTRSPKITGSTGTEQQQGKNIITPMGFAKKITVLETTPIVEIEYISLSGAPTNRVGTAGTPAIRVPVLPSPWTSLAEPMFHFPNGWVMVDLPWDQIPNTTVTLYKEKWQYIRPYSPGGD
jgi:hypothetical protein